MAEAVTKQFFADYKEMLTKYRENFRGQEKATEEACYEAAQQLLNRMLFLAFIQEKGLLAQDKRYLHHLWESYQKGKKGKKSPLKNEFYSHYLKPLFFESFNRHHDYNPYALPEEVKEQFAKMPYLNCSLFQKNEIDEFDFEIADDLVTELFGRLLEKYNFTMGENSPWDQDVAIEPEMLGKVHESLLAEEERGKAGIFYTPRAEIDFMCRQSIMYYLLANVKNLQVEKVFELVYDVKSELAVFSPVELTNLKENLEKVKIIDPACGAGSFLVQMLEIIKNLLEKIHTKLKIPCKGFELCKKIICQSLYGVDVKKWALRVAELQLWLKVLAEADEKTLNIHKESLLPNLRDILRLGDFMEGFYQQGFDIIIGNPPYITQIEITPPFFVGSRGGTAKAKYKLHLQEMIRVMWGPETNVDPNFDYLIYFYYKGLTLLKDQGILCFITQNAWLDAKYGFAFQEFLLKKTKILQIYNSLRKRSFAQADINTIISILQAEGDPKKIGENLVSFITVQGGFEDLSRCPEDLVKMVTASKGYSDARYRLKKIDQRRLLNLGGASTPPEQHTLKKYEGLKWGSLFLKAPDIYFKILNNANLEGMTVNNNPLLLRMEDLFDLKRGFTSGANDFFYFETTGEMQGGKLLNCQNKFTSFQMEEKFTAPFIKSPTELEAIEIDNAKITHRVFWCQLPKTKLANTKALEYVQWGENFENKTKQGAKKGTAMKGFHQRSSMQGRTLWYALNPEFGAHFFIQAAFDDTFKITFSPEITLADKRLYQFNLKPTKKYDPHFVLGLLNSSFMAMVIELNGISNLGEGVLNLQVFEAKACLLPNPEIFSADEQTSISASIKAVIKKVVPPIYDRINDPAIRKIDAIIFHKLGLNPAEIETFYEELVFLVDTRKKRAKSLK